MAFWVEGLDHGHIRWFGVISSFRQNPSIHGNCFRFVDLIDFLHEKVTLGKLTIYFNPNINLLNQMSNIARSNLRDYLQRIKVGSR